MPSDAPGTTGPRPLTKNDREVMRRQLSARS